MNLEVEIPVGDKENRYRASEAALERCLGRPVVWRFLVHCLRDDPRLPYLAGLLESGQVKAKLLWNDAPLGLEAVLVKARWSERLLEHLVLEAHVTTLGPATAPAPDPDPFTPRWRVHDKVPNLLKLAMRFAHVAVVPNWVKTLEKVKFTPGEFTSVVQDGLSDWAFFSHLMDQYGFLGQDAAMKPLVLVGSVQAAPGKWLVTYGSKAAYQAMNDIDKRQVEPEPKTLTSMSFDPQASLLSRVCPPTQPVDESLWIVPTVSRVWRSRAFTPAAWTAWSGKDLPLFTKLDQRFVYRVVDRLFVSDDQKLEWSTQLDPLPEGAVVAGPEPTVPLKPWLRLGEVSETRPAGPWIKVKLEGFESGSDILQVRLQSPYSGTNGKRGLHLVPENKTRVLLSWSGRFHEPFLVLGNIREQAAEYLHPSLWLEALTTEQFTDVLVKKIGKTTVESDYDVEMKMKTTMKSVDALAVTGNATTDITSMQAFKLTGQMTTDIASTGPFKIDGQATTDIASMGPLTLDGKAATLLKGAAGVHLNP